MYRLSQFRSTQPRGSARLSGSKGESTGRDSAQAQISASLITEILRVSYEARTACLTVGYVGHCPSLCPFEVFCILRHCAHSLSAAVYTATSA